MVSQNPLLLVSHLQFGLPCFRNIAVSSFPSALTHGITPHNREIQFITNNLQTLTFENTIDGLGYAGRLLDRANKIFSNIITTDADAELQVIAIEISKALSRHWSGVFSNAELFKRLKHLYSRNEHINISSEQHRFLEKTYKKLIRSRASLTQNDKLYYQISQKDLRYSLQNSVKIFSPTKQAMSFFLMSQALKDSMEFGKQR